MSSTASIESLIKTVASAGTPEAVGGDVEFVSLTLIGKSAENTPNNGVVTIQSDAVNNGGGIKLSPEALYTINAPEHSTLKLSQVFLDVAVDGDGVVAFYVAPNYNNWNNVESKLEKALQRYFETQNARLYDVTFTRGFDDQERTGTNVTASVTGGPEAIDESALWKLSVDVTVRTKSKTNGLERHDEITAFIRDMIMVEHLPEILTSMQPNFSCQPRSAIEHQFSREIDSPFYNSTISFTILASGSNIN